MTTDVAVLTEEDVAELMRVARSAAKTVASRYRGWVEFDDVLSEVQLYALDGGAKFIGRQLAREDVKDGWRRILLALRGAAKAYCENEKAVKSGYSPDDVAWYAPEHLAVLIPIALDDEWENLTGAPADSGRQRQTGRGPANEGNSLLAMICDVRWAIDKMSWTEETLAAFRAMDFESEAGLQMLEQMADFLGGDYPGAPGYRRQRRRVVSNAQANALLGQNESDDARRWAERMVGQ